MKRKPAPNGRKRKVLIVDDHPLLRDGLAKVINQQADLAVCGEAADARAGLAAAAQLRPDVVIADLTMDEGNGLDLIKDLHLRQPGLPVLVLSMHHENLYAERAVRAGARGYVMKREPVAAVLAALRKVLAGQMAFSEETVRRLLDVPTRARKAAAESPADVLSDRELEVFRLLGQGFGTRQIAQKLRLATSTVETYRAGIKQKLGLTRAPELVARAAQFVLDEPRR
ncbi:MAG TPA: response regulator transcription factor [Kiritimatiellia bacterium]|nr:response regulator transcription factor [Kiritimatiellia bacterium]